MYDTVNTLREQFKIINPISNGIPVSVGSCHSCAIETALSFLNIKIAEQVTVGYGADSDPLDNYKITNSLDTVNVTNKSDLYKLLVSMDETDIAFMCLEGDDIDHSYNAVKKDGKIFIVDSDRCIYKEITSPSSFVCKVTGWDDYPLYVDYSNAAILDSSKLKTLKADIAVTIINRKTFEDNPIILNGVTYPENAPETTPENTLQEYYTELYEATPSSCKIQ